jgi:hypothetical protein
MDFSSETVDMKMARLKQCRCVTSLRNDLWEVFEFSRIATRFRRWFNVKIQRGSNVVASTLYRRLISVHRRRDLISTNNQR